MFAMADSDEDSICQAALVDDGSAVVDQWYTFVVQVLTVGGCMPPPSLTGLDESRVGATSKSLCVWAILPVAFLAQAHVSVSSCVYSIEYVLQV